VCGHCVVHIRTWVLPAKKLWQCAIQHSAILLLHAGENEYGWVTTHDNTVSCPYAEWHASQLFRSSCSTGSIGHWAGLCGVGIPVVARSPIGLCDISETYLLKACIQRLVNHCLSIWHATTYSLLYNFSSLVTKVLYKTRWDVQMCSIEYNYYWLF